MLVETVAGPGARERTVSTLRRRAGIELPDAALGAHGLGCLYWVEVGVVAEDMLGRGRGGRVERHEKVTVFLGWDALEIVHPVYSGGRCGLVKVHDEIKE